MKKMMLGVFGLLLMVSGLSAADKTTPEFERLKKMVGEWRIEMSYADEKGNWSVSPNPTFASISVFKNGYIRELHTTPGAKTQFNMEITYSYNRFGKFYQIIGLDEYSGVIDMFRGQVEGDAIVFDNTLADTTTTNEQGQMVHWRVAMSGLDAGKPQSLVSASVDGGKTWRLIMRGVYHPVEQN